METVWSTKLKILFVPLQSKFAAPGLNQHFSVGGLPTCMDGTQLLNWCLDLTALRVLTFADWNSHHLSFEIVTLIFYLKNSKLAIFFCKILLFISLLLSSTQIYKVCSVSKAESCSKCQEAQCCECRNQSAKIKGWEHSSQPKPPLAAISSWPQLVWH